jgi:2-haloalkanoic acid dehalogenase type II
MSSHEFSIHWGKRFFDIIASSNHDNFRTLYDCELISLREALAEIHVDPTPYVRELEEYWSNPPIYADALEFLRTVDMPICCVSNADTQPLQSAIRRHNLRFDGVVSSEQVQAYKPDPKIFHAALKLMGVRPNQAVHVGDSLHSDISGANQVGLTTVWIERDSRIHDIGSCKPNRTISTLAELATVMKS